MATWSNLSQRERTLVGVILPLVCVVLFYLYLWQPTHAEVNRLRLSVPEKNANLAWMRNRLSATDPGDQGQAMSTSGVPLLTEIERVAIAVGVNAAIQRVQPGNDDTVEMWFQEVVADQLFRWVDLLAGSGIVVDTATITRASPGLVSARIKVRRGAS